MPDRPTTASLAVLGHPVAHSLSPALHTAAYRVLGLTWTYGAVDMTGDRLPAFLHSLDTGWRGLSLTMPLKQDVLPLLDRSDELVRLTGSANTVLVDAGRRLGFNTDVTGIVQALAGRTADVVQILGAGATAASAVVAASRLGAALVHVSARSPGRAGRLRRVAEQLGVRLDIAPMSVSVASDPDVVISTLPGGAAPGIHFTDPVASGASLLEVAYDPWPGPLAARWLDAGGEVVPGIEMLAQQALAQVRVFVGGDPELALDDEVTVFAAMRDAVGLHWMPAPPAGPV